jgi:CheY-like chemotaxis protein
MEQKKTKHILVIEDARDLQLLLGRLLEREGYTVSHAYNGQEALNLLRSSAMEPPSLILLDIMMPVMDGLQFRQEQQKDPLLASIPVIAMTAFANPEGWAQKLGVTTLLKKPVSADVLLDLIEKL